MAFNYSASLLASDHVSGTLKWVTHVTQSMHRISSNLALRQLNRTASLTRSGIPGSDTSIAVSRHNHHVLYPNAMISHRHRWMTLHNGTCYAAELYRVDKHSDIERQNVIILHIMSLPDRAA